VTIHGEDQLVEPEGGSLFLHLVRLEQVSDTGLSVASIVDDLLAAGAPAEELYTALSLSGIPPAELSLTEHVRFDVLERMTFPIDADSPRIIPESFVGGSRPAGVVDVSYKLDLDHQLDRALKDDQFDALVSTLAGE
jgi:hypothetical protein